MSGLFLRSGRAMLTPEEERLLRTALDELEAKHVFMTEERFKRLRYVDTLIERFGMWASPVAVWVLGSLKIQEGIWRTRHKLKFGNWGY